jgi:hypothetical protein
MHKYLPERGLGTSPVGTRRVSRESGIGNKGSQSQKDPFTESCSWTEESKSGHQRVIIHEGIPDFRLRARGATQITLDEPLIDTSL